MRPDEAASASGVQQVKQYGWIGGWYDQFHYARMARALGHFHLPGAHWDHVNMTPTADAPAGQEPSSFSFGLGYPLVGALFFMLGFRGDAFVVPDGLLFALSAMLALVLARRLVSAKAAFVAVNALMLST